MRLLAFLMLIGFALDPLLFFGGWEVAVFIERPLPEAFFRDNRFYWGDVTVAAASAALWWITRT
ncbi:MAG TPA: hypothetical protein VJ808_10430, partial [Gemmatimonadales bacterium]|nr:hypothetical protein [Gemmatimonadales bacterium]